MQSHSLFIVDDHTLFREGFRLLLQKLPYISRVDEASCGEEFLSMLDSGLPDMVFMDISMPGAGGIETTRRAMELFPELKIVALSMYTDEDYTSRMINAGARGFILKNSGIQDVEDCIRMVTSGHNFFSPEIMESILRNLSKNEKQPKNSDLSERETEVLSRICLGLSNQEIAGLLRISKRTVDKHRENLLLKTGSKNTAGLVMFAIRNGIVQV